MNGIGRLPALMDQVETYRDIDIEESLDRLEEAREKLGEKREARNAFLRELNRKPPEPTALQGTVQSTSNWMESGSTVTTTAYIAASILAKGTLFSNPWVGGAIAAHHVFDSTGGYEWLKEKAIKYFDIEEQSAMTALAALRLTGYAGSMFYSANGVCELVTESGLLGVLGAGYANGVGFIGKISSTANALIAHMNQLPDAGIAWRVSGAITAAASFVSQGKMLAAYRETSKGQFNEARNLELQQEVKQAQQSVDGHAKAIKRYRAEAESKRRDYSKMADAMDISVAAG